MLSPSLQSGSLLRIDLRMVKLDYLLKVLLIWVFAKSVFATYQIVTVEYGSVYPERNVSSLASIGLELN